MQSVSLAIMDQKGFTVVNLSVYSLNKLSFECRRYLNIKHYFFPGERVGQSREGTMQALQHPQQDPDQ